MIQCASNAKKTQELGAEDSKLKIELEIESNKRLDLECDQKKNNLLIFGFPETSEGTDTTENLCRKLIEWLNKDLSIQEVDIDQPKAGKNLLPKEHTQIKGLAS